MKKKLMSVLISESSQIQEEIDYIEGNLNISDNMVNTSIDVDIDGTISGFEKLETLKTEKRYMDITILKKQVKSTCLYNDKTINVYELSRIYDDVVDSLRFYNDLVIKHESSFKELDSLNEIKSETYHNVEIINIHNFKSSTIREINSNKNKLYNVLLEFYSKTYVEIEDDE
jgi:hypothetical protein